MVADQVGQLHKVPGNLGFLPLKMSWFWAICHQRTMDSLDTHSICTKSFLRLLCVMMSSFWILVHHVLRHIFRIHARSYYAVHTRRLRQQLRRTAVSWCRWIRNAPTFQDPTFVLT